MTDTPIADVVDLMVGDGASAKAIAAAVRAIEASAFRPQTVRRQSADTSDNRRERDRLRKAQKRAEMRVLREAAKANDVAARPQLSADTSADNADTRSNLTVLSSSESQLETEKVSKKKRAVVVEGRGVRLPVDWQPDAELRQFALDHNVDPDMLRSEFVDYWIGIPGQRGCRTADRGWPATWRNRVRAVAKFKKEKSDGRRGNILPAADRLVEKLRDFERGDEPDMLADLRGGEGAPHVRMLPSR